MGHQQDYQIAIIGAGASGLMAAAAAARSIPGDRILLLEKNAAAGRKLYATGNGRCNFLNRNACPGDYFSREGAETAKRWTSPVFRAVPPSVLESVFSQMGVPAAAQEEGRLYPRSMQAESVVEALLLTLEAAGIGIRTGSPVERCSKTPEGFLLEDAQGNSFLAGSVILAAGGKAGPQYGSQGDGYKLAAELGHRILKPIPSLTQLLLEDPDPSLFGVRVRGEVSLWRHRQGEACPAARDTGEIQLTREGISGICTFNVSRFYEIGEGLRYTVRLDFFPEHSRQDLEALLKERKRTLAGRSAGSFLNGMLPGKLAAALLKEAGVDREKPVADLRPGEIPRILELCKSYSRAVAGTKSWKDAQVTAGGVGLDEVDPCRLMSRLVPDLYFAGEVLDVDGPCGGYNLTWAFASGWLAGRTAGEAPCCG